MASGASRLGGGAAAAPPAWQGYLFSSLAPTLASIVSNPAAVIKTQMQLVKRPADGGKPVFRNSWHCATKIYRVDGLAGLQRGLVTSMLRESSKGVFRLGLFRPLLGKIHDPADGPAPVWARMAAGAVSGAAGAVSANPFEVVRVRMQAQGSFSAGHQHNYKGVVDAFRRIVAQEGARGLYKATGASVARSMVGTSVNLTSYSLFRERLVAVLGDRAVTDMACALASGGVTTVAMSPIDVVRTRVMNQPTAADGSGALYRGAADAFPKILRAEGPTAFFKGVVPAFVRLGPHFVLTFMLLEQFRRAAHGYNARTAEARYLKRVFSVLDTDKSGEIDLPELEHALRAVMPPSPAEGGAESYGRVLHERATEIMERCDADGNGSISREEFVAGAGSLSDLFRGVELRATFDSIDLDKSGELDEIELYHALKASRTGSGVEFERQLRADVKRLLSEVDRDGNGTIDFKEFAHASALLEDLEEHRLLEGWLRESGVAQE